MKIAIFSDTFLPTVDGVTISSKNEVLMFSKDNQLKIFIPEGSEKIDESDYVFLGAKPLKKYPAYKARIPTFRRVYRELKEFKPDVIHLQTIFGIGLEGLICSKILKIPTIVTSHTIYPDSVIHTNILGLENAIL